MEEDKSKKIPYTIHGIQYLPDKSRSRGQMLKKTLHRKSSFRRSRSFTSAIKKTSNNNTKKSKRDKSTNHKLQNGHCATVPETAVMPDTPEANPMIPNGHVTSESGHSRGASDVSVTFDLPDTVSELSSGIERTPSPPSLNEVSSCSSVDTAELRACLEQGGGDLLDTNKIVDPEMWKEYPFPFENIVLSGGGTKGYAYIGALKALEDCGVLPHIHRVGGSSAGAICGALLAVGCTPQEIADVFFCDTKWLFQDQKCACCFYLPKMWKKFGINPGVRFLQIYGDHISKKVGNPDITFMELYKEYGRELCIVVTNLSKMCSEYCHYTTTPDLPIRQAVRMSMSFPVVYEAVKFNLFGQENLYMDGGTLDVYPIHCFDDAEVELNHNLITGRHKLMNNKTVGVHLLSEVASDYKMWDRLFGGPIPYPPPYLPNTKLARTRLKEEIKKLQKADENFDVKEYLSKLDNGCDEKGRPVRKHYSINEQDPIKIKNLGHYLRASVSTILVSQRRLHIKPTDIMRTVPVNCGYIATSDYKLDAGDREFMIRCGYEHTKSFLKDYIRTKALPHRSESTPAVSTTCNTTSQVPRSMSFHSRLTIPHSISLKSRETIV